MVVLFNNIPIWFACALILTCIFNTVRSCTNIAEPLHRTESSGGDIHVSLQLGRHIFKTNCLVCHQASGLGIPSRYPPLAGSEWVLAKGSHLEEHLILILLHGLQGPITVKGVTYNGYMSGWDHYLSDGEIAAVLSYIRMEWGNLTTPITLETVVTVRKNTPSRVQPWLWRELQVISPRDWKHNVNKE